MREPLKGRARDDAPAAGAGAVGRPAGRPFVREVSPAFRRVFDDLELAEHATPELEQLAADVAATGPATVDEAVDRIKGDAFPTPEDFR